MGVEVQPVPKIYKAHIHFLFFFSHNVYLM